MKIKDRARGGMQGRTSTKNSNSNKVKYNFDISILDLMCSYVVSKNSNIKRGNLVNMRKLFDMLDMDIYRKDKEKYKRVEFIKKGLEARLVKDLKKPALILSYINGGIIEDGEISDLEELSNAELEYIDSTVTGALDAASIDKYMDELYDLYTEYKAKDYRNRSEMDEKIKEFIKKIHNSFRKNNYESNNTTTFSFDTDLDTKGADIYDTLTSSSRYLTSGMVGFNELVGGGLEATRFYLIVGLGGIGKSMLMLNLALQMKKYNKDYQPKDPTKIPTILFLTQENTVEETVDRVCNIITGRNMRDLEKQDVLDRLKEEGKFIIDEDNKINIHIIYKPDRSIDTGDLYTIIEDIEDDGYEVIALFQDHIKRIKSINKDVQGDIRLELGSVVNEFKILAQLKQIPIISVSHANRDAANKIDNANDSKADLTRLLGRSNIGESMLMYDNADCVLLANRETQIGTGQDFLVLSRQKLRNAGNNVDYICQPFENNSGTKLVEDVDKPFPLYRKTLVPDSQVNQNMVDMSKLNRGEAVNGETVASSLNNMIETNEDNTFDSLINADLASCNTKVKVTEEEENKNVIIHQVQSIDLNPKLNEQQVQHKEISIPVERKTKVEPLSFIIWDKDKEKEVC